MVVFAIGLYLSKHCTKENNLLIIFEREIIHEKIFKSFIGCIGNDDDVRHAGKCGG